ncbi:uncharacterized protein LOC6540775 [Drosophila erecta]|uniref:Uncharacterized protein n=1 Tax=Drosophila erecta TaxID=7220 RepID=B3N7F6_DROER|nr:uncharacterized protein LOC6540775 [Drosophila erecta]EDV59361.1 uncharacterized protein Dere_GG10547 [Drosophila erecta]
MESRVTSGTGQPNTIMIQLVSQQPSSCGQMQAMPISVQTIPLFPNSRTSTERPSRSVHIAPSIRAPPDGPPGTNSRTRPENYAPPKRKHSQSQFRHFSRGINQAPPVYYVLRPEDRVMPIYIPPPRLSNGQGARMGTGCPCCGRATTLNTEETLGVHVSQNPFAKVEGHQKETPRQRDQCTNTTDQPDLGNVRAIYETLGRAMVTAAVEAAQKSQLAGPSDSKDSTNIIMKLLTQMGEHNQTAGGGQPLGGAGSPDDQPHMSKRKASFLEKPSIAEVPSDDLVDQPKLPSIQSDGRFHVEYPKTPRPTPVFSLESGNTPNSNMSSERLRLDSGSSPNVGNSIGHSKA